MRRLAPLLLLLVSPSWSAEPVRIAVAANFKPTLVKISAAFEAQTGHPVLLSSGSTGVLYTQIKHGAPFHLFFAADRKTPELLQASGSADKSSAAQCYAIGRLVLVGGNGTLEQLADPRLSLAIGNPATAPYGRAAIQVLEREEFQPGKSRKLVRGNNVAQAYQFWHSGAVDLALLPRALAPGPAALVPPDWHTPLEQYLTVVARNAAVDAYLNWLRSDTVRSVIIDAGYEPCP